MKKNYLILIISLFIILLLPVAYYFMYALPQHNRELQQIERDKLEYQKELDRLDRQKEEERLQQEKEERERKEIQEQERIKREKEEKEFNYNKCINTANQRRSENFSRYCELSYRTCIQSIDEWNSSPLHTYNQVSYSECDIHKEKDWYCTIMDKYAQERKEWYERQLKMCDRYK